MCLTIFFFPYALFEVPSNIVLKVLKPKLWLTIIVQVWGTVMTLMGLVQNYAGLLAARYVHLGCLCSIHGRNANT
jgi:hypothetical protein